MSTNPQRNELLIELGDFKVKTKMTFDAIVKIESLFDASIFEIVQKLNQGKIRADKVVDVIEIAAIDEVKREDIENAILETGSVDALTSIVPLLLSAFVGSKSKKVDEKKV